MANYADVKAKIDTYIKRNGIKAITGNILNGVLTKMLNELGAGYQYGGMAVPSTDPGTPDYNVVYLAATAGTYEFFDGITLADGEIALLKYNGSWSKETVGSFYTRTDIDTMLENYVRQEPGKGLSTNDYTDEDKAKLDGIEPGAQVNVLEGVSVNGNRLQPDQNKVVDVDVPTDLSELNEDAEHRLVTDDDITNWDAKYAKPAGGIPAEDLAQAVRDLLALADSSLQPSDIVQETGQQTGKVMSQKAVTDAVAAVESEVSQLGQKVLDIDYTLNMLSGQSINVGSYDEGEVVNTTPHDNPSISCILLAVSKNAIIKITGRGGSGPRLWAILDADKKLIAKADATVTETNLKLTIAQDGYVIVNAYTADPHSVISLTPFATSAELLQLSTFVNNTFDAYAKDGSFFDSEYKYCISKTTGEIRNDGASNVKCTTKFLPIKPGLKIFGCTGTIQTLIAFYDSGLNFISAHTTATQGVNSLVTLAAGDIPSGAKYFRSSGFDGAYIEGLTDNDLIKASAEVARVFVSDIGFNPLSLNIRDRYTIATNASIGDTISLTYTLNEGYACSVTAVKAGDIVHFCGYGSNSYRVAALTDKTLKLLYKSNTERFYSETLYVSQDGFLIINYSKSYDYLFYVECADKNILPFKRARWIAMGDSMTQGYYSDNNGSDVNTQKCWAHLVSAIKRNIFYNAGVGGQGYKHEVTSGNATDLVQTIDFSDYDLVTLMYGINDYKGGDSLGSMDDVVADKGSVIACLRFVIETIIASNPLIKIVLITPLNARGYEGARLGDETTNYAIGYEVNGKTLEDFFDAFVEVCKYYGIQYVDMTHASIVNRKNIATALPDGVHPALDTHLMLARELSQKITVY